MVEVDSSDFRQLRCTVDVRKRNAPFEEPNKILFGLNLFGSVCWVFFSFGRFFTKLDRFSYKGGSFKMV